jgi:hypothetical protein
MATFCIESAAILAVKGRFIYDSDVTDTVLLHVVVFFKKSLISGLDSELLVHVSTGCTWQTRELHGSRSKICS